MFTGTRQPISVSFLEMATLPTPSFLQLPTALVGLRSHGPFPKQFSIFFKSYLFSSCLDNHVGDILWT